MTPNQQLLTVIITSANGVRAEHVSAIESIASQVVAHPLCELAIGGYFEDATCGDTLRRLSDEGKIVLLVDAGWMTSPGAIERTLTVSVKTPYILFLDCDASIKQGGVKKLIDYIEQNSPFHVAGFPEEGGLSLDMRCVLVNTALLRSTGTYQVPLSSQHCRPTELLQQYLGKRGIAGHFWGPDMAPFFELAPHPSNEIGISAYDTEEINPKLLTACVCAYGDHPTLLFRCLQSLCEEQRFAERSALIVGCNAVSDEGLKVIYSFRKRGFPVSVIRSRRNLNKSGMRRMMATLADSRYIASCDDDIFLKPHWLRRVCEFITDAPAPGPDAAGCTLYSKYYPLRESPINGEVPYSMYAVRRKWWRWRKPEREAHIAFPGGCFHLIKTEFIRTNDYPDSSMLIDYDDILLGDLILQVGGIYTSFPTSIRELVIVDLNPSRGTRGHG